MTAGEEISGGVRGAGKASFCGETGGGRSKRSGCEIPNKLKSINRCFNDSVHADRV